MCLNNIFYMCLMFVVHSVYNSFYLLREVNRYIVFQRKGTLYTLVKQYFIYSMQKHYTFQDFTGKSDSDLFLIETGRGCLE